MPNGEGADGRPGIAEESAGASRKPTAREVVEFFNRWERDRLCHGGPGRVCGQDGGEGHDRQFLLGPHPVRRRATV
jgi:hypothetical protein